MKPLIRRESVRLAAIQLVALYAALWLTALVMFGRPPTVLAHLVMAICAVPFIAVALYLFRKINGRGGDR